jgi:hypothetical protein
MIHRDAHNLVHSSLARLYPGKFFGILGLVGHPESYPQRRRHSVIITAVSYLSYSFLSWGRGLKTSKRPADTHLAASFEQINGSPRFAGGSE